MLTAKKFHVLFISVALAMVIWPSNSFRTRTMAHLNPRKPETTRVKMAFKVMWRRDLEPKSFTETKDKSNRNCGGARLGPPTWVETYKIKVTEIIEYQPNARLSLIAGIE